jgi:diguanylate cyclase (GGDEF)-like protein
MKNQQTASLFWGKSDTMNEFDQKLINMSELMPVGIAILKNGDVIHRNKILMDILQLPEELLYVNPWLHLKEKFKNRVINLIETNNNKQCEIYIDFTEENKKWIMLNKESAIFNEDHYVFLTVTDINDLKNKETEYDEQQIYLNNVFESIFESIIVIDNNNIITRINSTAKKTLSRLHEIKGKHITDFLMLYDTNGTPFNYLEPDNYRSNDLVLEDVKGLNHYVNFHIAGMYDKLGRKIGKIISFFEINEEKKKEREVLYLTYHDVLTGLYNRTFFEQQLDLLDSPRKLPLSVILGDVNGLKLTNDVFGHQEGDILLKRIARVLKNTCRSDDIIARWGGDEFIILMPNTSEHQVNVIMNRISAQLEQYYKSNEIVSILPSLSLGYGVKEEETTDIYAVIKIAENNMYKRKMLTSSSIYNAIVKSMTNSLYERSNETEEHAQRLFEICFKIATALDLSEAEISDLQIFSQLHDIGKIGIPDNILNKPGKLNEQEWSIMKTHPEVGYRIANSTPELKNISRYILSHHERYDGTGYPKKLKGEEIPLLSRLLSIADAYDAMTHNRSYQKAISKEEAILEIIANSGTQFDPKLVNIFTQIIK